MLKKVVFVTANCCQIIVIHKQLLLATECQITSELVEPVTGTKYEKSYKCITPSVRILNVYMLNLTLIEVAC